MARMVVRAVVKANSQSNGKEQILTPYGSKTPEQILMKPKIYNYVVDMTTYANPCSAKTWHHMFWFLLYSWAQPTPIVRFWRSIHHMTCCSTRMCLLGVSLLPIPIYGLNSPKKLHFRGVNGRFQAKRAKYWKFYITETTASILTKFCTTIETIN